MVKFHPSNSKAVVSPARAAAFEILMRIACEDSYAAELLHSSRYAQLSAADHGLATELVMGILRWQSRLDDEIRNNSTQPLRKLDLEVLIALRLGLYQLRWLDRIPARAAIHESVELVKAARKRSAASFTNAVLRKLSQGQPPKSQLSPATAQELAGTLAHPEWLVTRWWDRFGSEMTPKICEYDQKLPEAAIRLRQAEAEVELEAEGIVFAPGRLLASARIVKSGDVTRTAALRSGRITIQDEGSQLIAALVGRGDRLLDCCCAPGGKTSLLADRNPQSKIVAVELHPHRARLTRKLLAQGNVQVVSADARELPLSTHFDRILVDVPCSGTGTLARNPEIKWRLSPQDLADLQLRQTAILQAALHRLSRGGRLVYSSCSLEKEENEQVIETVLGTDKNFRLVSIREILRELDAEGQLAWRDVDSLAAGNFLRTIPGVHPCDGFWAAVITRIE